MDLDDWGVGYLFLAFLSSVGCGPPADGANVPTAKSNLTFVGGPIGAIPPTILQLSRCDVITAPCGAGYNCDGVPGTCIACGAQGQEPCNGYQCNSGLAVASGACTSCNQVFRYLTVVPSDNSLSISVAVTAPVNLWLSIGDANDGSVAAAAPLSPVDNGSGLFVASDTVGGFPPSHTYIVTVTPQDSDCTGITSSDVTLSGPVTITFDSGYRDTDGVHGECYLDLTDDGNWRFHGYASNSNWDAAGYAFLDKIIIDPAFTPLFFFRQGNMVGEFTLASHTDSFDLRGYDLRIQQYWNQIVAHGASTNLGAYPDYDGYQIDAVTASLGYIPAPLLVDCPPNTVVNDGSGTTGCYFNASQELIVQCIGQAPLTSCGVTSENNGSNIFPVGPHGPGCVCCPPEQSNDPPCCNCIF